MDIQTIILSVLPLLFAITFHEASHGFIANKLGDPTARLMGRLTLNPIAHIDLIGTILMPLILFIYTDGSFVIGYAKPVPINPMNFRDPKKDMAISAAAGPITNILLATLSLLIFALIPATVEPESSGITILAPLKQMFEISFVINVILAVINLLPIPPLDGGRVLIGFLPHKQAVSYGRIEPYGFIIVITLFLTGIAGFFLKPMIGVLALFIKLLVGLIIGLFSILF